MQGSGPQGQTRSLGAHFAGTFHGTFCGGAKDTVAEGARVDIEVETNTTDPRAQDIWIDSVELEEE